jgi:hypothetical protein
MTTEMLPDWLILSVAGLSAEAYAGLPEEICRRIEVVDGAIVVLPSPWPTRWSPRAARSSLWCSVRISDCATNRC